MKLHEIKKIKGATHSKKKVGRGPGSGLGKTSGRGHKGQLARSGGGKGPMFEGGQIPLYKRLPQRGFSNARFKVVYAPINVDALNAFEDGAIVSPEILKDMGIIKNQLDGVKVLGNGALEKKLTVRAHKFSKEAKMKIEKIGGKAEVI